MPAECSGAGIGQPRAAPAPSGRRDSGRPVYGLVRADLGDGRAARSSVGSRVEYWNDAGAPAPNSLVPACGVLAVDERGRVLVQRRRDTGQWALPMGKMELGERPSQCAIRETREETGVLATLWARSEAHHAL